MSALFPFRALRPDPRAAADVASVPYDVVSTEEARALASDRPLSFLHVTRSEIDLPAGTNPYDALVYDQAVRNFEHLERAAPLVLDDEPSLYCYRLRMGPHQQVGWAGCFAVDEYERGTIKKHEKTRQDKEDDRTRHILELRAQTGLVFLTHRATPAIDAIARQAAAAAPLYDLTAADGVQHTIWRVTGAACDELVAAFGRLDALYIADGHHRAASAARARQALPGRAEASRFVAVAFPHDQMQILPYNRVVKDLGGLSAAAFLDALRQACEVGAGSPRPAGRGEVTMYLDGRWHGLRLPAAAPGTAPADGLDVEVLQQRVLGPLLQIGDPRTDKRIDFVGGIRGPEELERLVASGRASVAFSMYPVSIDDLMLIADEGGIMPPKSTWFEPKLRDGLLVHLI
ncbi:MAG: DUF1015 domain-containing protein [Acidobacteria bacterium]|nr:DUF1015 domain-containing protein [Acidobacteriota bacterium]